MFNDLVKDVFEVIALPYSFTCSLFRVLKTVVFRLFVHLQLQMLYGDEHDTVILSL